MHTYKKFLFGIGIIFIASLQVARGESVRGTFNNWGNAWMAEDSVFGGIWKTTHAAIANDVGGRFKFDRFGDWQENWGKGSDATVNQTVGNLTAFGGDISLSMVQGGHYTFTMAPNHNRYAIMQTDQTPVDVLSVDNNHLEAGTNAVTVQIDLSSVPSSQESVWVRYSHSVDFAASHLTQATGAGATLQATIPGISIGQTVYYYILTSTMPRSVIEQNYDLCTMRGLNNGGSANFSFSTRLANAWHLPNELEPFGRPMRQPVSSPPPNRILLLYTGTQFTGGEDAADQIAGIIYYRLGNSGDVWQELEMQFIAEEGNNKFWGVWLPEYTAEPHDLLSYFFKLEYADRATTYLGYSNGQSTTYASPVEAMLSPFTVTYGNYQYELGIAWHIPENAEPPGTTMRSPLGDSTNLVLSVHDIDLHVGSYLGDYRDLISIAAFAYVRRTGDEEWGMYSMTEVPGHEPNQYWRYTIGSGSYRAGDAIEYFIKLLYTERDPTYVAIVSGQSAVVQTEEEAAQSPFGFTYDSVVSIATNAEGQVRTLVHNEAGLLLGFEDGHGELQIQRDGLGRITQIVDRQGNAYLYEYDEFGNVIRMTDPLGHSTRVVYNSLNLPILVTTPSSYEWQYEYDVRGNLIQETDPLGHSTQYQYDSAGLLIAMTNAGGHVTRYQYDAYGNPTQVWFPDGTSRTNEYDALDRPIAASSSLGNRSAYVWDSNGRLLVASNAVGAMMRNQFNLMGQLTNQINPSGHAVSFEYDRSERLTSVRYPNGATEHVEYNANGEPVAMADPMGNRTSLQLLQGGIVKSITNALNQTLQYEYNAQGKPVLEIAPGGRRTEYAYDAMGRRSRMTDHLGFSTYYDYDADGRLSAITNDAGQSVTLSHDPLGNVTEIQDALGRKTHFTYDPMGNMTSVSNAVGQIINFEYDEMDRRVRQINPDASERTWTYDSEGRRTSETDENGNVQLFEYDAIGQLARKVDALGHSIGFGYDLNGNLIAVTNELLAVWRWEFDEMDQISREYDALGNYISYEYDLAGNLIQKTKPDGVHIQYRYDKLNRLTNLVHAGENAAYAYDADGQLIAMHDTLGDWMYGYDVMGRVTNQVDAFGNSVSFEYDSTGRLSKTTYPHGGVLQYAYNAMGQCTNLVDWAGRSTSYNYDSVGRLTNIAYPNGVVETRLYDDLSRLVQIRHAQGESNIVLIAYTYDPAGNPIAIQADEGLKPVLQSGMRGASFDPDNRMTQEQGNLVQSDPNGNITNYMGPSGPSILRFSANDLMTSYESPALVLSNQYNAQGHRVARIKNGVHTRFVVVPNGTMEMTLADTDEYNQYSAFYVHGPGGLAYSIHSDGSLRTYHGDLTGNIQAICGADGGVKQRYTYSPYGRVLAALGELADNEFQYVGKWGVRAESDELLFMRARFYSTQLAQFVSKDSIRFANRFHYAANSPLLYMDPSGNVLHLPVAGIAGGVALAGGFIVDASIQWAFTGEINWIDAGLTGLELGIRTTAGVATVGASEAVGWGTGFGVSLNLAKQVAGNAGNGRDLRDIDLVEAGLSGVPVGGNLAKKAAFGKRFRGWNIFQGYKGARTSNEIFQKAGHSMVTEHAIKELISSFIHRIIPGNLYRPVFPQSRIQQIKQFE